MSARTSLPKILALKLAHVIWSNAALARARMLGYPRLREPLPDDLWIYVVGDIHGRADLLFRLHKMIDHDRQRHEAEAQSIEIYLGDYCDRGPDSRRVIDAILERVSRGHEIICLLGNHEQLLLDFLQDPDCGPQWFAKGGVATLESYGVSAPAGPIGHADLAYLNRLLNKAIPGEHRRFLGQLSLMYEVGDYLFVHAGLKPGREIQDQAASDLISIRREFVKSRADHPKVVVHGHSFYRKPVVGRRHIGIDTGAYASGTLTALVLHGQSHRFLTARARARG